ncbi:uncharacterized protein LOC108224929 isoform X2 [Daucus carota subsp. sativus]|uniref:uncharacterized protein LOC108224929 isoform X2 n=1 Tax=Daucus carota subsp. sativus TaxID=79200 RepID=UPI003082F3C3
MLQSHDRFVSTNHQNETIATEACKSFNMASSLACRCVNSFPQFRNRLFTTTSLPKPNAVVFLKHIACSSIAAAETLTSDAVVVSGDGKYGRKEIISITPRLYDYLLDNILRELREETSTMRGSQMQVSPDQAQLLAMLVQILGAEKCIEVGVYTGYSSLAVALVLPESGRLVACERDGKALEVAKRYYEQAGVLHKVDVRHGLAADALKLMIQNGEGCSYDFAFVDADKRNYQEYFELLLQLVRVGGIIVIDNVLWHGKVANPLVNDAKTVSIRNFNQGIMEDERVSISMVPIGDGITICRKN